MALGALSHIAFTVRDLDRSAAFYDLVLGAMGYARWPAVAGQAKWKKPGVGIVLLYTAQKNQAHDRTAPGLHHYSFEADTRAEVDALRAAGALVVYAADPLGTAACAVPLIGEGEWCSVGAQLWFQRRATVLRRYRPPHHRAAVLAHLCAAAALPSAVR